MIQAVHTPRGWTRADVASDQSWIHHLSQAEIDDLRRALDHALRTGKTFFEMDKDDFPITPTVRGVLEGIIDGTQRRHGMRLLRGFPVQGYSEDELRIFYWGLGLQLGVPRPQGKSSSFMSDVRDAGGVYRATTGRGYNTSEALDFHADGADIVSLMVIRTAKSGGQSLVASSIAAHNRMLAERPDLVQELYQPFVFSRQGEEAPEEAPYYRAPIFGVEKGHFVCRHIRNHIKSAQISFADIPRLTDKQIEALDYFDALLEDPDLCYRFDFQPGDIQFLNNHIVLHSRTNYEDEEAPEKKRFLLRLWLAIPDAQPLPQAFREAYKDVNTRAVRGGFRGQGITPQVRAFEERMARAHGMACNIYYDRDAVAA